MDDFTRWLAEGDLTSDGRADEIVAIVLKSPGFIKDLVAGLGSDNSVIRGNAADAVEKIGREAPELLLPFMHRLLQAAQEDPLDKVQWHLAMLFGYMALFEELIDPIFAALTHDLDQGGGFTKSWAMTSLCIIACLYPDYQACVVGAVSKYKTSSMPSVRSRAEKVLETLLEGQPVPENWVKCPAIQAKLDELRSA